MGTGRRMPRVRGASPRMVAGSLVLASLFSVILGQITERSGREAAVQPGSDHVVTIVPQGIMRLVLASERAN
jgi:hypothetical protein